MPDFTKDFFKEFLNEQEYRAFLNLFEKKKPTNIDPNFIYRSIKDNTNLLLSHNRFKNIKALIYLAYARAGLYKHTVIPLPLISLEPFENFLKDLSFYDVYIKDIRKDLPVDKEFAVFIEAMFAQLKTLYVKEEATLPSYYRLIDEFFRNNPSIESYYKHNHLFVFYILSRSSFPFFKAYLTEEEFKIYSEKLKIFSRSNSVYFGADVLMRLEQSQKIDESSILYLRFLAYYRSGYYSCYLDQKSIDELYNKGYKYSHEVKNKYDQLKRSAKKRKIDFSLTYEDVEKLLSVKRCYYTGIRFKSSNSSKSRSIDRIDNKKGYEKGNVVACCKQLNLLKSNLIESDNSFTYKQLQSFMDKLGKKLFNDD